jgi:molecular chaperone DnaJ
MSDKDKSTTYFYELLGIEKSTSKEDINKVYKKLARKYHPDVCKEEGAEDKFKEIGQAYEILKDDKKREIYDKYGMEGVRNGGGPSNFGGNIFDFFTRGRSTEDDGPKKGKDVVR